MGVRKGARNEQRSRNQKPETASSLLFRYTLLSTCRSYGALFSKTMTYYIYTAPTGLKVLWQAVLFTSR